jgi:hypothetical protein
LSSAVGVPFGMRLFTRLVVVRGRRGGSMEGGRGFKGAELGCQYMVEYGSIGGWKESKSFSDSTPR